MGHRVAMLRIGPVMTGELVPIDEVPAFVGQLAHQPIGLQRVGEPGLGPAVGDAAADHAFVHALAPFVEQGQLAARLPNATRQPVTLRVGRPCVDLCGM